ncbi:MAG: HAD-IA family hydrolase [bacterium]|nr:HAD-IA family hydrolase [bacterium]
MYRTIIFDLGGVYFSDGTRTAIDAIADRYKIDRAAGEDVLNGDAGKQYRIGMLSVEQFWQMAKTSWNIQESTEALSLIWCSSYRPNDDTAKLVDRLKDAGHELLYLSDNTAERVAYLDEKYRFLQKFDEGIFSHIVKRKKPDPVIYQLLVDKASHPATACVYIDDKPEYLQPAKKLGMEVIAFTNAAQLESMLKELALL